MTAAGWIFAVAGVGAVLLAYVLLERGDNWRDKALGLKNEVAAASAREGHTTRQLLDALAELAERKKFLDVIGHGDNDIAGLPTTENHDDPA